MSTATSQDLRCPRCAAHVRAGSDWCTLCYTDLRPAPPAPPVSAAQSEPEPAAPPRASATAQQADEGPEPDQERAPVRRGKHSRQEPSDAALDPEAAAQVLLAQLAAAESGDPFGRWSGLLDSPGKKVALMAGGAVVATSVLFIVMAVLGALL